MISGRRITIEGDASHIPSGKRGAILAGQPGCAGHLVGAVNNHGPGHPLQGTMHRLGQRGYVPLHLNVLGTSQGVWVIRVGTVIDRGGELVDLGLVLTRRVADQILHIRLLDLVVFRPALNEAFYREYIATSIREWIENTPGNGRLDLSDTKVELTRSRARLAVY